jgi:hypothetical protein
MVDYNVPFSGGRITIPSQAAADYLSQQGEIKPQDKTLREKSTDATADKLMASGMSPYEAYKLSKKIMGDENAERTVDSIGVADFLPAGLIFGAEEARRDFLNAKSPVDYIAPSVGLALSVAEAFPLTKLAAKALNRNVVQPMARRLAKAPTTPAYRGEAQEIVGDLQVGHPGRKDSGWLGEGLSSTNSPRLASMYSLMKAPFGGAERAPNVMPVNLSLKNPLVITYDQKQTLRFMQPEARQNWLNENVITKGHDGVTVRFPQREYEGGPFVEEYMVLDPSQIRSRFDVPEGPVRSFLSSLKGKL